MKKNKLSISKEVISKLQSENVIGGNLEGFSQDCSEHQARTRCLTCPPPAPGLGG